MPSTKEMEKKSLWASLPEYLLLIPLGLASFTAIWIAYHEFFEPTLESERNLQVFMAATLAFLAIHFIFEKIVVSHSIRKHIHENVSRLDQIDRKFELWHRTGIETLDAKTLENLVKPLTDYANLQKLKLSLKESAPEFGKIVDSHLHDQNEFLQDLSEGEIKVSNLEAANIYLKLSKEYEERFDAVSHNDLGFWNSRLEENRKYFKVCAEQSKGGTPVTRIFIFSNSDEGHVTKNVFDRHPAKEFRDASGENQSSFDTLIKVLEKHNVAEMAWGIAIEDEFDDDLLNLVSETTPDFALFDKGKAVSFFRKRKNKEDRDFSIIFDTGMPKNSRLIKQVKEIHVQLISNCWLVNSKFALNYKGMLKTDREKRLIQEKLANKITIVKNTLGEAKFSEMITTDGKENDFLLVADKTQTATKVDILDRLLNEYQLAGRKDS